MKGGFLRMVAVAIGLVLAAGPVCAEQESDPGWAGSVGVGLNLTSGNSDTVLVTLSADAMRSWERDVWKLNLMASYGETEGEKSMQRAEAGSGYQHLFDERWYGGLNLRLFHDSVASVEYRVSVGPSLGYYFVKSAVTKLNAEAGPSFVVEKVDVKHPKEPAPPPPNPDFVTSEVRTYLALRLGERFERQLSERARVWQTLEVLPQVDRFENFLAQAELGVEAGLNAWLNLRLVVQDKYDNEPPKGRKRNDVAVISSVVYKF
jgi:putative salt-induced outer membrane protein YdiY